MANEGQERSTFGDFSIETFDNGLGSAQLANELLSPETSTASPDDIVKIDKEKEAKEEADKKAQLAKAKTKEAPKKDESKDDNKNVLDDFLGGEKEESSTDEEEEATKENLEESKDDNRFSALAKDLFSLNVFTKEEDEEDVEIDTPEALLERFNHEKRKGAEEQIQNFLGRFGEDYQNAFQAIFVKGVDPKEYFGTYDSLASYSDMDLSIESNQEAVVKRAYIDQGMEPADADAKLEKIKSYGDLEDEAQRFHKVLVKKEAAKLAQLEQDSEKRLQQLAQTKQQYAQNVTTILQDKLKTKEFDGIPINPTLAQELADFLVTDKYKTSSGETLTEFDKTILELKRPENHAQKVKVGLLLKMLQKDPKLSTLLKIAVTKEADKIFSSVTKAKNNKETTKQDKPARWFV